MSRYFLLILVFAFGCHSSKTTAVEKPDDLIPKDKMIQVLADVHLLEASLNVRSPQLNRPHGIFPMEMRVDSTLPAVSADPNSKTPLPWFDIFQKRGITRSQYESSMKWYCTQPEVMNDMYDQVIIELTKRQLEDRTPGKSK